MVPFLYLFLGQSSLAGLDIPSEDQAVIAHATSLLVIVPVSLRGAWLYHRARSVEWDSVWRMGLASVVTAFFGARVAIAVPGQLLKVVFGLFLLVIATRLLIGKPRSEAEATGRLQEWQMARAIAGGAAVGFFSALLGVGGGLVAIPVLIYGLHTPLRRVSGTSLALITFTAFTGVIAYGLSGALGHGDPLQHFHLPAALGLAVGAVAGVPIGTATQLRLPTHTLRWLFAVVFVLLGLRIAATNLLALVGGR